MHVCACIHVCAAVAVAAEENIGSITLPSAASVELGQPRDDFWAASLAIFKMAPARTVGGKLP